MNEWDGVHADLTGALRYGALGSYRWAADWMEGCGRVEDWGCGGGGLRGYLPGSALYVGVDGSVSPYASVTADLAEYRSSSEGIVVRHVLEHDHRWRRILDNAVASFTKRLAVVFFTPHVGATHLLATEVGYGDVPVYAFARPDIEAAFDPDVHSLDWEEGWFPEAHYGREQILRVST